MKKLFLIDGHALIFKMYYAFLRRPMINSKGMDTSILFGFTKYLLELIRREEPTHLAVMFDPPAKTFRHELDPQYKATRSAAPELVKAALEPLEKIAGALRIPVLMKAGFEADDIIGTVARRFASDDCDVYMVTPDKDLGQIVDDHIFQYRPGKAGAENEILSKDDICAHYGIEHPLQVIDILAIWGDASDNVAGVRGVGEVGARKLVAKFGSIEQIQAHLEQLPQKQQDAFRDAAAHLPLSRTLVTIRTDVDIDVTETDLRIEKPDTDAISALFDLYEFNSLADMLPEGASVTVVPKKELECREVSLNEMLSRIRKEGRAAVRTGSQYVLACGSDFCRCTRDEALSVIADPSVVKTGFGLKDRAFEGKVFDIEIMHYLLDPERAHRLDILARTYLGIELEDDNQDKQLTLFDVEDHLSGRECVAAGLMEPMIEKELEEASLFELYTRMEMPLIKVLADMESTGVKIDSEMLASYRNVLGRELSSIESQVREMSGVKSLNLSSPKQIGQVLFEKLELDPKAKKNSRDNYHTDEETLSALADKHPIVNQILEFREIKKLITTYIEPLQRLSDGQGKVHTTFTQALTATGRLSSIQPNLQNIPIRSERGMKIREAFVPSTPDGFIVSADYSQIELRVMAHLSGDPGLSEGFANGADVHRATAAKLFAVAPEDVTPEQRRRAKAANFGIIYGMSAFGLAQRMDIPRSQAKEFIEEYFRQYPKVKEYIDNSVAKARETGYVTTAFGRKRFLPDINSRNQTVRSLAERNAVNAPIQGTAADIIKLAMTQVCRRMKNEKLASRMVLQVHDELVFDVVAGELDTVMRIAREEMEGVCRLSVPLIVECNYGKNWREAH